MLFLAVTSILVNFPEAVVNVPGPIISNPIIREKVSSEIRRSQSWAVIVIPSLVKPEPVMSLAFHVTVLVAACAVTAIMRMARRDENNFAFIF